MWQWYMIVTWMMMCMKVWTQPMILQFIDTSKLYFCLVVILLLSISDPV